MKCRLNAVLVDITCKAEVELLFRGKFPLILGNHINSLGTCVYSITEKPGTFYALRFQYCLNSHVVSTIRIKAKCTGEYYPVVDMNQVSIDG